MPKAVVVEKQETRMRRVVSVEGMLGVLSCNHRRFLAPSERTPGVEVLCQLCPLEKL